MELVCHQPGKPTVPAVDENHGKPFMHVTSDIPGGNHAGGWSIIRELPQAREIPQSWGLHGTFKYLYTVLQIYRKFQQKNFISFFLNKRLLEYNTLYKNKKTLPRLHVLRIE